MSPRAPLKSDRADTFGPLERRHNFHASHGPGLLKGRVRATARGPDKGLSLARSNLNKGLDNASNRIASRTSNGDGGSYQAIGSVQAAISSMYQPSHRCGWKDNQVAPRNGQKRRLGCAEAARRGALALHGPSEQHNNSYNEPPRIISDQHIATKPQPPAEAVQPRRNQTMHGCQGASEAHAKSGSIRGKQQPTRRAMYLERQDSSRFAFTPSLAWQQALGSSFLPRRWQQVRRRLAFAFPPGSTPRHYSSREPPWQLSAPRLPRLRTSPWQAGGGSDQAVTTPGASNRGTAVPHDVGCRRCHRRTAHDSGGRAS